MGEGLEGLICIAVVGRTFSGKDVVLDVAKALGYSTYGMGNVVREYYPQKHAIQMPLTKEQEADIRTKLRTNEDGTPKPHGVAEWLHRYIEERERGKNSRIIFVGNVVSKAEADYFRRRFGDNFYVIAVESTDVDRIVRSGNGRGGRAGGPSYIKDRAAWEDSVGLPEILASANVTLHNKGTTPGDLKTFETDVGRFMALVKGLLN
jgi:hypothetical protein